MKVYGELHAVQCLKSAEACINSRPLYMESKDVNDVQVVSPENFLRVKYSLPEKYYPPNVDLSIQILKNINSEQSGQVKNMWQQLQLEYFTQLRKYHMKKGCFNKSRNPIKVGESALIKHKG